MTDTASPTPTAACSHTLLDYRCSLDAGPDHDELHVDAEAGVRWTSFEERTLAIAQRVLAGKSLEGKTPVPWRARFEVSVYENGRVALPLYSAETSDDGDEPEEVSEELYSVLTVNLPEAALAVGEILVRTTEENEHVAAAARATGLFADTGRRVRSNYIEVEVWKLVDGGAR